MKLPSPSLFRSLVTYFVLSGTALSVTMYAQAPSIDKIDPPGWWTGLPDPMLLAHGEHLNDAHFSIAGKGVRLLRTQISGNGHWAFLWLRTRQAAAQTVLLSSRNSPGVAQKSFEFPVASG
jgi:hypothetical protein